MKNYEGFINQVPRLHYGEMLIICNKCGTENHFYYDDTYYKKLEDNEKYLLERLMQQEKTIDILTNALRREEQSNEELKTYKTKFDTLKKCFDENILKI